MGTGMGIEVAHVFVDTNGGRPSLYVFERSTLDRPGRYKGLRLTGDSGLLGLGVVRGECPLGVLLDRLEEYPEECEADPVVVAAAVEWLRNNSK